MAGKRSTLLRPGSGGVNLGPKKGQARKAQAAGSKPIPSQIDTIIRRPKGAEMPGWFRTLTGMVTPLPLTPATNMAANKLETGKWDPGAAWQQTKQQAAETSGMDLFNPAEMPPLWRGKKVDTAHLWRGVRDLSTPAHVPRRGYQVTATENPFVAASYGYQLEPVTMQGVIRELEPNFRRSPGENFDYNKFDTRARTLRPGEMLRVQDVVDPGTFNYDLAQHNDEWGQQGAGRHNQWATRSSIIPGHRGKATVPFMDAPKELLDWLKQKNLDKGYAPDRALRLTGAQKKMVQVATRDAARRARPARYAIEDWTKTLPAEAWRSVDAAQRFVDVFETLGALPLKKGDTLAFGDLGDTANAQLRGLRSLVSSIHGPEIEALQTRLREVFRGWDRDAMNYWQREFLDDARHMDGRAPFTNTHNGIDTVYGNRRMALEEASRLRGVDQIPKELQRNFIGPLLPADFESTTMVPMHVIGKTMMNPEGQATAVAKLGGKLAGKPSNIPGYKVDLDALAADLGGKAEGGMKKYIDDPTPGGPGGFTKDHIYGDDGQIPWLGMQGEEVLYKANPTSMQKLLDAYSNGDISLVDKDKAMVQLYKDEMAKAAGLNLSAEDIDAVKTTFPAAYADIMGQLNQGLGYDEASVLLGKLHMMLGPVKPK